jgi:hypothetical protein
MISNNQQRLEDKARSLHNEEMLTVVVLFDADHAWHFVGLAEGPAYHFPGSEQPVSNAQRGSGRALHYLL